MLAKQVKVPNVQIGEGGRGPRQLGHNFFFLLKARTPCYKSSTHVPPVLTVSSSN
jgi:hypothetical protein